jgi:hypothetical protein
MAGTHGAGGLAISLALSLQGATLLSYSRTLTKSVSRRPSHLYLSNCGIGARPGQRFSTSRCLEFSKC